jgi:hypothetical protein
MTAQPTLRELDHRVNDGIDVWLLWRVTDDQLVVAVADAKHDEAFTIEVARDESPLDVFHHPFAYRRTPPAREDRRADGYVVSTRRRGVA